MSKADHPPDDLTHGDWAEPSAKPRPVVPDRRISTGCRAELASETSALLRERLRAATLMLAIAFGIFLVRDICFPKTFEGLVYLHGLLAVFLSVCYGGLASRWTPTTRQLQMLEIGIFGLVLVALIVGHTIGLRLDFATGTFDPAELRIQFKHSIIGTLLLILTYGIFIPNSGRRATWFIIFMAAAPLVAPAVLGLTNSGFRHLALEAWTPERLTDNLLFLALGAAIAIFGSYTLSACRDGEFRARWLNQYRLGEKLGSGGMGEVYMAKHDMLRRPCAIKLIRPSLSAKPRVMARFEREAQATARLSHWNTVDVYDYGCTEDGTFYYVMEYLPGLSLQALVDRHGPLPPGRVIYLLRQACDALCEAHEAGFIHRDLKPPNIFASYRGAQYDVAKLLDFGLVKVTKEDESPSLTREGMVTGSPLYMAPEQVMRSHPPDTRTDLYALGAIAYFLLTGQPPFTGPDSMAVMVAQARDPVVPPSALDENIPADLEAVVLRCLHKDPKHRFQDAASLAAAFAACANAGDWSADDARAWWSTHEPKLVAELTASETTEPGDSNPGSFEDKPEDLTLGASEIEAVGSMGSGDVDLSASLGDDLGGLDSRP